MIFNLKGQGALEYLLLIAGAILIAVIVIALLIGMGASSRQGVHDNVNNSAQIIDQSLIYPILDSVVCEDVDHVLLSYRLLENNQPSGATDNPIMLMDEEIVYDGGIPVPLNPGAGTRIIGVCNPGTTHKMQIRLITNGDNFIDSNPISISN